MKPVKKPHTEKSQSYEEELYTSKSVERFKLEKVVPLKTILKLERKIQLEKTNRKSPRIRLLKLRRKLINRVKFNATLHEELIPINKIKSKTYDFQTQIY